MAQYVAMSIYRAIHSKGYVDRLHLLIRGCSGSLNSNGYVVVAFYSAAFVRRRKPFRQRKPEGILSALPRSEIEVDEKD